MNESIYYTVDAIHNAISENKKIRFQYYQWNVKKEMELRRDGAWYHISPWGLSWDDENYYLVGFDSDANEIRHYRVDKMLHIQMSNESREGKEVMMIPVDEEHFTANVDVMVSSVFLGWVFSLGERVKILGPEEVVEKMREEGERLVRQYQQP